MLSEANCPLLYDKIFSHETTFPKCFIATALCMKFEQLNVDNPGGLLPSANVNEVIFLFYSWLCFVTIELNYHLLDFKMSFLTL